MAMFELLKTLFETLIGVVFSGLGDKLKNKPKLCLKMVSTPDDELYEKGLRTKTCHQNMG